MTRHATPSQIDQFEAYAELLSGLADGTGVLRGARADLAAELTRDLNRSLELRGGER